MKDEDVITPPLGGAPVALAGRFAWVDPTAAEGGTMFHFSHPRSHGDTWRRVVLAIPFIVAAAFLSFVLIMVLIGATNGFEPNP